MNHAMGEGLALVIALGVVAFFGTVMAGFIFVVGELTSWIVKMIN